MTQISYTQLDWIVMALNHHIADVKREMDAAPDDSPTQSLGELFLEGRQNLVTILTDAIHNKVKTISIR